MVLDYCEVPPRRYSCFGTVLLISLHADPTTTVGSPENGGVTIYVRELARALVAAGWAVDILTRRQSPFDQACETYEGAHVVRIDAGPAQPLSNDEIAKFLPQARETACALAAARAYRFVSSHYWLSGVVGEAVARERGIAHVHTPHSHGVERKKRDAATLARIAAERRLLQTAKIVALSKSNLALFRKEYGVDTPVHVVPAGVDTSRFCHGDRNGALRDLGLRLSRTWIGYVGRLTKEKGIDDLLRAFALLRRGRANVGLFVVGGARERSRVPVLALLAERLRIIDAVRFLGPIPNDRIVSAFNAADVIAIPSHYEAFGLVALEARAVGAPIVASDVGGLRELVRSESGGVRVPVADRAAWTRALDRSVQPRVLRERRALAMRRREGIYSWRTVADLIVGIALSHAHA